MAGRVAHFDDPAAFSFVSLDKGAPLRRLAHTPEHAALPGFDQKFDHFGLFYDVFRSASGRHVWLIGPVAINLEEYLRKTEVVGLQSGHHTRLQIHHGRDVVIARAKLPEADTHLRLSIDGQTHDVLIQPNRSDMFKGERVVTTISRNNRLEWIADWAKFYVKEHGATAFLFYDNNSDQYAPADVQRVLEKIPGVKKSLVIPWNFSFAVKDYDFRARFKRRSFAHFAQPVMFPHSFRKYAQTARSLLNVDIDELVISPFGKSVFSAAERSLFGYVKFNRIQIDNTRNPIESIPRHAHYVVRKKGRPARLILKKWALNPKRDWLGGWRAAPANHAIFHWFTLVGSSTDFYGYHFEAVSTSWDFDRSKQIPFDSKIHEIDPLLKRTLKRIFGPNEAML